MDMYPIMEAAYRKLGTASKMAKAQAWFRRPSVLRFFFSLFNIIATNKGGWTERREEERGKTACFSMQCDQLSVAYLSTYVSRDPDDS